MVLVKFFLHLNYYLITKKYRPLVRTINWGVQRESHWLLEAFGKGQGRLSVRHVLAIAVRAGSRNGLPFHFGWFISVPNLLCRCLMRRGGRSQEGGKVVNKVTV